MKVNCRISSRTLIPAIEKFLDLTSKKIISLEKRWDYTKGTPVFTIKGQYSTRGWTEWTQGFQYGCAILQYDMTREKKFLNIGREKTIKNMAPHVSHIGVHDHGFNNLSTYGNLRRLILENVLPYNENELQFYELAIKLSGAIQAARWTDTSHGHGFIHSFNGPHSLFSDTMRSLRVLGLAHELGHVLMGEGDRKINLLGRLLEHAQTNAQFNVYYGESRDQYDVNGRVAHESIFNTKDGQYRCPSTQQGYSPFSTWTRGLAWVLLGYAEQLEYLTTIALRKLTPFGGKNALIKIMERAALATAELYIENSFADGISFWDMGAPGVSKFGKIKNKPSDPYNDVEPLDSSSAAICGQGYLRLGNYYQKIGDSKKANRYRSAAFTIAQTLLSEPYISNSARHQGITLHAIYHRPNGWDYTPPTRKIPCGESAMWGDYHTMELVHLVHREAKRQPYPLFFQ